MCYQKPRVKSCRIQEHVAAGKSAKCSSNTSHSTAKVLLEEKTAK